MSTNRYGIGRSIVRKKRAYLVKAECCVEIGFYARDADQAEDLFNDYQAALEDSHPELVFSLRDIREDDVLF